MADEAPKIQRRGTKVGDQDNRTPEQITADNEAAEAEAKAAAEAAFEARVKAEVEERVKTALAARMQAEKDAAEAARVLAEQEAALAGVAADAPKAHMPLSPQTADLERAVREGAEYVSSKRMTIDRAAVDLAGHFKLPVQDIKNAIAGRIKLNEQEEALASGDVVICEVPKACRITLSATNVISLVKGTYAVQRRVAEHWYAKAHGVRIVAPAPAVQAAPAPEPEKAA